MTEATKISVLKEPAKLENPIFIEGLPGVGQIGRITVGYLIEQLKAEKFAELLSAHFYPFVMLHQNSSVRVLKNEFYYWKAKEKDQRDLILMVGDSQSIDPTGHYEIVETTLDFVEKYGVKEIFTIAGLSVGSISKETRIVGAVSDSELAKKYKQFKIDFNSETKVGTIVGASGLFIGLGKYRGMKGVCLLGETANLPDIPDPKSAEAVLKILTKILNVEIDMSKLQEKIKDMEKFMKKIGRVQDRALKQLLVQQMGKEEKAGEEELKYIG